MYSGSLFTIVFHGVLCRCPSVPVFALWQGVHATLFAWVTRSQASRSPTRLRLQAATRQDLRVRAVRIRCWPPRSVPWAPVNRSSGLSATRNPPTDAERLRYRVHIDDVTALGGQSSRSPVTVAPPFGKYSDVITRALHFRCIVI